MNFEDILYEVKNGVAWITINRPEKMNAFRGTTCDEIIKALAGARSVCRWRSCIRPFAMCPSR